MHNTDIIEADAFANKVQANLHMLGTLMLNRVAGEIDRADVVTINNSGTLKWTVELHEQLAQPISFRNTIGGSAVLSLSAGPGHCILPFG